MSGRRLRKLASCATASPRRCGSLLNYGPRSPLRSWRQLEAVRAALLRLFASFTLTGQDDFAPADDVVLDPVDLDRDYVIWTEPRATALVGIDEDWFPIYERVALHSTGQNDRVGLPT
jgi:hypothetical protein